MIKIADATAGIREQHDWCARTAGCAFQRHVTDFDVEAIEGRRLRLKERRLGGSRTSAGYEARSGSCRCAGEQVTARQSRFGHDLLLRSRRVALHAEKTGRRAPALP